MQEYLYATTKDRKGNTHSYKLPKGEGVPVREEITELAVAGRFKFVDFLSPESLDTLNALFPNRKPTRA